MNLLIIILSLFFLPFTSLADFRVKRDLKPDITPTATKASNISPFFKKLESPNKPSFGNERFVSELKERFFCADLSADIAGIYSNLWSCEEITEFHISPGNDFDCRSSFLLIEVLAKFPEPSNKTTMMKKVDLYLPRYGALMVEQQYSEQCVYLKRFKENFFLPVNISFLTTKSLPSVVPIFHSVGRDCSGLIMGR